MEERNKAIIIAAMVLAFAYLVQPVIGMAYKQNRCESAARQIDQNFPNTFYYQCMLDAMKGED